jgi:hypothetical protein
VIHQAWNPRKQGFVTRHFVLKDFETTTTTTPATATTTTTSTTTE